MLACPEAMTLVTAPAISETVRLTLLRVTVLVCNFTACIEDASKTVGPQRHCEGLG